MKQNKLHNARLMREVKTISRMTHKNIVRYYQAWVEGSSSVDESNLSKLPLPNNEKSVAAVSDEPLDDSESSDGISKPGWWQKSPLISSKEVGNLALEDDAFVQLNDISVEDKEDSDTSSSWSRASSAHSQLSYGSVLYQLQNPLLTGFDFQQTYDNIFPKSVESIEQLSDTRETGSNKNIILYIQMEFCATTLRHLIDDGSITTKMGEKEIWRLLRQLTVRSLKLHLRTYSSIDLHCALNLSIYLDLYQEALSYVHKLRVIHRDLK
jgi:serine/threonine protein kinase